MEIGKKPGYLTTAAKKDTSIGSDVLEMIISKFPELDINWLLTGKGEMLKDAELQVLHQSKTTEMKLEEQDVFGSYQYSGYAQM